MQLTLEDAAKFLNLSERQVRRLVQKGELPAYKVQHQYRFNRTELVEWAIERKISFSPALLKENGKTSKERSSLVQALRKGGIFYDLKGGDKKTALQAAVQVMPLPETINRELILQILLAREALASTGIGEGIAIPHARNPVILHVRESFISLAFLERGVDFGSLDGKPVYALFNLVSSTTQNHLYLLSRLAFALSRVEIKRVLERRAPETEILAAFEEAERSCL